MKWGYVSYHFLYCYINYCILCNEKAEKKLSWAVATLHVHIRISRLHDWHLVARESAATSIVDNLVAAMELWPTLWKFQLAEHLH
jgi:hypothetical protein